MTDSLRQRCAGAAEREGGPPLAWSRAVDAVLDVIEPELAVLADRVIHAEAAAARVRALHVWNSYNGVRMCGHCSERAYPDYEVPWPCPTIAALDSLPAGSSDG